MGTAFSFAPRWLATAAHNLKGTVRSIAGTGSNTITQALLNSRGHVEVVGLLPGVVQVVAEDPVDAQREQVPGARLDGGEGRGPGVLQREGVQDGGVAGALQFGVQRRLDGQPVTELNYAYEMRSR